MRSSLACAAPPVGTVDGRVPSRFTGKTLELVTETKTVPAVASHVVQKGDTLYSLARRFNTTVDKVTPEQRERLDALVVVPEGARQRHPSVRDERRPAQRRRPAGVTTREATAL
jgi:hypothetical protein